MVRVEPGLPDRESLFVKTVASEDLLQACWQPGTAHVINFDRFALSELETMALGGGPMTSSAHSKP
jgi:hypothetical protein